MRSLAAMNPRTATITGIATTILTILTAMGTDRPTSDAPSR